MNAIYILFTENMIIIIFIVFLLKPIFIYIKGSGGSMS